MDLEDLELLSSFVKSDKPEGVILLDITNPLPYMVAFRIGWFMEDSLEYYTPWTPVTPDYLRVVATYLAWTGVFKNVMIKCQIKAISQDMKNVIFDSINDVFRQFACNGEVQEGTVYPDGTANMEKKERYCAIECAAPPIATISFSARESRNLEPIEKDMIKSLNKVLREFIDDKGDNIDEFP